MQIDQLESGTAHAEDSDEAGDYRYTRFTTRLLLNDLRFGTSAPRAR